MKKLLTLVLVFAVAMSISCSNTNTTKNNETNTNVSVTNENVDISKFTNNKDVRLAFAKAIDKEYIEKILLNNGSKAADYFVNSDLCFDEEGNDFRDKYTDGWNHYNIDEAKTHWEKAKKELNFDKFSLKLLTFDEEDKKKIAEYIVTQLNKNLDGLNLELDVQPYKNKLSMSRSGKYDIEYHIWGADYADPMTFIDLFLTDNKANAPRYSNKEYDKLVLSAKSGELSKDAKKRFEALQEAEKILLGDDVAIIPLYQEGVAYLERAGFKDFQYRKLPPYSCFRYATTDILTNGKEIIRMASYSDIPSLNSTKSADEVSFDILAATIDTLTELDDKNNLVFRAAESVDISDDNLVYTFHLRKNAKWQNGTPVTAKDFEFGFKTLADPKNGGVYSFIVTTAGIKNSEKVITGELDVNELGVKAIDDYTFEVTLDYPVPFFLKLLSFNSFSPVNEEFFNKHKENYGTSIETTLCNGAYIIDDWKIGYGYSLRKNENYWDSENVKNDGVDFRVIKDVSSSVNMYENGEIDWCKLSGEHINNFSDRNDFKTTDAAKMASLRFNLNNR